MAFWLALSKVCGQSLFAMQFFLQFVCYNFFRILWSSLDNGATEGVISEIEEAWNELFCLRTQG